MAKTRIDILYERAIDVMSNPNWECVLELIAEKHARALELLKTASGETTYRAQGSVLAIESILKLKEEVLDYLQLDEFDSEPLDTEPE
jgi:hypothetical protein